MKKAILLSLPIGLIMAAMPGTRVQAQGQMVVYSKSNPSPSTWQLDQLMSLHFDNERLYVQPMTIGTTAFSLADVRCIKFAEVVNALQTLNAQRQAGCQAQRRHLTGNRMERWRHAGCPVYGQWHTGSGGR